MPPLRGRSRMPAIKRYCNGYPIQIQDELHPPNLLPPANLRQQRRPLEVHKSQPSTKGQDIHVNIRHHGEDTNRGWLDGDLE